MRIGQGIDVHAFYDNGQPEQWVTLAGVKIPHTHSLKAHSDGDVVLHSLADGLLGALALGDIGQYFPDTDPQYQGADSAVLLKNVYQMVQQYGYQLVNADITVMAEKPKLLPFREAMRQNMADYLNCQIDQISVKATTTEKLGFTGRQEGIMASCVVLLQKK